MPAVVASVPVVGSVTEVLPVVVSVVVKAPEVVRLPPSVIVPVLATPVPPLLAERGKVMAACLPLKVFQSRSEAT